MHDGGGAVSPSEGWEGNEGNGAPLRPSCTLAPRQSLGRWGMLSPHLLQGPSLLSQKASVAACSWDPPSVSSLLISTLLRHRGRLIIAFRTCDTGRGGGRIPVGFDVLLKTSRMLRDGSLVPTERGQFLQLGSYLGTIWGPDSMLEAGKWTEDTPKPVPPLLVNCVRDYI